MLGKEDRQISFFDTRFACSHLIDKKSFYAKMRECANKIIIDDDFTDMYCLNGLVELVASNINKVNHTLRGSPLYVHLNGFASLLYSLI